MEDVFKQIESVNASFRANGLIIEQQKDTERRVIAEIKALDHERTQLIAKRSKSQQTAVRAREELSSKQILECSSIQNLDSAWKVKDQRRQLQEKIGSFVSYASTFCNQETQPVRNILAEISTGTASTHELQEQLCEIQRKRDELTELKDNIQHLAESAATDLSHADAINAELELFAQHACSLQYGADSFTEMAHEHYALHQTRQYVFNLHRMAEQRNAAHAHLQRQLSQAMTRDAYLAQQIAMHEQFAPHRRNFPIHDDEDEFT